MFSVKNVVFSAMYSEPRKGCNPILALTTISAYEELHMAALTQARALEYFNYEPVTGRLLVNQRPRSEFDAPAFARHLKRVGRESGCVSKTSGYRAVMIDGQYYPAHHVIWLIMTGEPVRYPDFEIDHINGRRSDNRWDNLRKVTKSDNQRNSCQRVNNTSGVHGVNWKPKHGSAPGDGRWVARIWNGPRHVYLGAFKSLKEAAIARKAAERVLGFTRTNEPPGEFSQARPAHEKRRTAE